MRVTLRTRLHGLRRRAAYRAIRRAIATSLARSDFRIVQLVARDARLELLVEADDRHALARGLQGFQVACARQLNRAVRRSGCVFPDRYRALILRTRSEVRRAVGELASPRIAHPESWLLRRPINPDTRLSLPDRKLPP